MQRITKGKICKISALVLDVGAPFAATLSQFPVWIDRSANATISGLFILFAFLSLIFVIAIALLLYVSGEIFNFSFSDSGTQGSKSIWKSVVVSSLYE